jgi:hypothetical protein
MVVCADSVWSLLGSFRRGARLVRPTLSQRLAPLRAVAEHPSDAFPRAERPSVLGLNRPGVTLEFQGSREAWAGGAAENGYLAQRGG